MTELVGHTPMSALAVVKRARLLYPMLKLLWIEDWLLDQTERGSFLIAPKMGDRLGCSGSTIEKARRLLCELQLMNVTRGRGRGDYWFPVLPRLAAPAPKEQRDAILQGHQRALDDHLLARAGQLSPSFFLIRDWMIETHRKRVVSPTAEGGPAPPDTVGQPHRENRASATASGGAPTPAAGGAFARGGVGGELFTPKSSERAVFTQDSDGGVKTPLSEETGEKRAREKRGANGLQPVGRIAAALVERFTPPTVRVAGES